MLNNLSKVELSQTALFQKVEDEFVILDSESGQYYTLDAIGSFIIEHLQNGLSIIETVAKGVDEFEVSNDELEKDIIELIEQMLEKKLLVILPSNA